jgi:AraC-like DNA-binding protein
MATISSHHVKASLTGYRRQGGNDRALLARAGINPAALSSPQDRIHTDQVGRLFRLIQQELDDEFMGFTENPCKYGAFSTFCTLTSHCRTLGELLEHAVDLYNLLTDDVTMSLSTSESQTELGFVFTTPALDSQHFMAEFLLVIWHRFPSWYIGEAIRLVETHFTCGSPAHHQELAVMYPGELHFNEQSNRLIFDSSYLKKTLIRKPQELEKFLHSYPQDIMTIPGIDGSVEAQVERHLAHHCTDALSFPGAQQLADEMGMGKVTLYRNLKQEGTSYQRIKDNIRRERSIELLTRDDLSVDSISEIIGFSEARSFTRAFRAWTGLSPRQYRKLRQGPQSAP